MNKYEEILTQVCEEFKLDAHIKPLHSKKDVHTLAEKAATGHLNYVRDMPVKNSTMYCNGLDMCFYFECGVPSFSFAGHTSIDRSDVKNGSLVEAFETAVKIITRMQELKEEYLRELQEKEK